MSRLRFPFRSTQSQANVNGTNTLSSSDKKDIAISNYWDVVDSEDYMAKGKSKDIERLWGLENFGNTCYCNSVLQALYHCDPFRQFVEAYGEAPAPQSALGPPPGVANLPVSPTAPSSPLATKRDNPFDAPGLLSPTSPPGSEKSRWKLGRKPTSGHGSAPSLSSIQQGQAARTPTTPGTPGLNINMNAQIPVHNPLPLPNPDQQQPTVFETIQTLFTHLNDSPPHQPLPSRKDAKKEDNAQTASLLPSAPATTPNGGPTPSLTTSSTPTPGGKKDEPQGPPLLASLPPPSAPRGGGPFSAGTLGRGVVRPEDLLKTVKRENEMFQGMSQQDAHEFLGWVLNKVAEEVAVLDRKLKGTEKEAVLNKGGGQTWVQRLFEGCLTNETRCLSCESTSSRDELFLDLSIDIEQHTSVTSCLRAFSASEMLCQKNKFFCDSCCGLQEAEKRMKIKRLPNVLALHLKRFKYQENLGRYTKLFYRVPFPLQLRLPNTTDDSPDPDRLYELFSVVVHIGNGPHHGHYVCIVRSNGRWVMCDDENVEPIEESDIFRYFGDYPSGAGYVLFYQAVDLNLSSMGLKTPPRVPTPPPVARPAQQLVDVEAPHVNGAQTSPQAKAPLKVDIPTASPVAARDSPSLTASSHASTPPQPASAGVARTPSIGEKAAFGFTPAQAPSGLSASKPKEKEKESKWFNRRKSSIGPEPAQNVTPVRVAPVRQSTNQTVSSVNSATTPAVSTPIRETLPTPATGGLSSSVISSSALSSNSGTQASPLASQGGLGRQPSMTSARDRTVSTSSQNSSAANSAPGTSYSGGGSIGRKLSGTKGLLGRSGSFMKLGLGKKDKKGGNAENIEE